MALELERVEALAAEDWMPVEEARASLEEEAATADAMSRHVYVVARAV